MSTAAVVHPFRRRRVRKTIRLITAYSAIAASTLAVAPAATAGMHDGGANTDGWSWNQ